MNPQTPQCPHSRSCRDMKVVVVVVMSRWVPGLMTQHFKNKGPPPTYCTAVPWSCLSARVIVCVIIVGGSGCGKGICCIIESALWIYVQICVCVYIYIVIWMYICVHMYIHVYRYMHSHIHTYLSSPSLHTHIQYSSGIRNPELETDWVMPPSDFCLLICNFRLLFYYYVTTALLLYHYCTTTVLLLYYYFRIARRVLQTHTYNTQKDPPFPHTRPPTPHRLNYARQQRHQSPQRPLPQHTPSPASSAPTSLIQFIAKIYCHSSGSPVLD